MNQIKIRKESKWTKEILCTATRSSRRLLRVIFLVITASEFVDDDVNVRIVEQQCREHLQRLTSIQGGIVFENIQQGIENRRNQFIIVHKVIYEKRK
jgi:hypothetical protein